MKRPLLTVLIAAVLLAASAAGSTPSDLKQSYLFTPAGRLTPLHAATTYQASLFPIPLHVRVPTPGWSGVQWKSGSDYFRGGGPPNYGWVHSRPRIHDRAGAGPDLNHDRLHPHSLGHPNGERAAHARPRCNLRPDLTGDRRRLPWDPVRRPDHRRQELRSHRAHHFIPFSPVSHAAKYYPDEYPVYGDIFRVIVLNVRGKTVVVYIENVALPPQEFPTFLTKSEQMLGSLRFPAGTKRG